MRCLETSETNKAVSLERSKPALSFGTSVSSMKCIWLE